MVLNVSRWEATNKDTKQQKSKTLEDLGANKLQEQLSKMQSLKKYREVFDKHKNDFRD